LGDVIRALSGPLAPVPCLSKTAYERCGECVDEATCAVRMLLQDVHAATLRIVDGTTLADLAARGRDDQP
jgi:DNA-binding IscR family transcriptional regulator